MLNVPHEFNRDCLSIRVAVEPGSTDIIDVLSGPFGIPGAPVHIRSDNSHKFVAYPDTAYDVNWGWTVGAVIEYGIDNGCPAGEYLYADLGGADWEGNAVVPGDELWVSRSSADYRFSVVRLAADIRFQPTHSLTMELGQSSGLVGPLAWR